MLDNLLSDIDNIHPLACDAIYIGGQVDRMKQNVSQMYAAAPGSNPGVEMQKECLIMYDSLYMVLKDLVSVWLIFVGSTLFGIFYGIFNIENIGLDFKRWKFSFFEFGFKEYVY